MGYLDSRISDVDDLDFKNLVEELCDLADFDTDEFADRGFRFMLSVFFRKDSTWFSLQDAADFEILDRNLNSFPSDSVLQQLFAELAVLNKVNVEEFADRKIFILIKQWSKKCCPAFQRPKKLTRNQEQRRFATELIMRRRKNNPLGLP